MTYILDTAEEKNTNVHEQNPLKCHFNEFYNNTRSVFNSHWRKPSQLRYNTYKTSKIYTTIFIGTEIEVIHACDVTINTTSLTLYFVPINKDSLEEIGYQYNHITLVLG